MHSSCSHQCHVDSAIVFQCKKRKRSKTVVAAEAPGKVVLGGIEILSGALVWVLPVAGSKQLGGLIIADGMRRTFDGLADLDEENKKKQEENTPKP